MQKDLTDALVKQRAKAGEQGEASPSIQSPGLQQSPIQQYVISGQMHNVTLHQSPPAAASILGSIAVQTGSTGAVVPSTSSPGLQLSPRCQLIRPASSPGLVTTSLRAPSSQLRNVVQQALQKQINQPSVMNVQSISPGRTVPIVSQTSAGPVVLQELQIQHTPAVPSATGTSVSLTGGTIHHLGQSPSRLVTQLGNSPQNVKQTSIVSTQQTVKTYSVSPSVNPTSQSTTSSMSSSISATPRLSPGIPRKKMKLEEKPAATPEIKNYRQLIIDQRNNELSEINRKYVENLKELFFLQNGGNLMDYLQWQKRPTVQLTNFLRSGVLDSEEEIDTKETRINNEVKVITSSGSTTPIGTPVAISTMLPAAVSAISQQGTDAVFSNEMLHLDTKTSNVAEPKKLGGRHGMVFGPHQPTQPQQLPQLPGGIAVLVSPTQLSDIVHHSTNSKQFSPQSSSTSLPGNVSSLTSSVSVQEKTALVKSLTEPISSSAPSTSSSNQKPTTSSATGVNKTSPPKSHLQLSAQRLNTRQHSISAVYDTAIGSQEAIVERAKQEAQVIQRVAELRKDGLWSTRRLPKVQEPSRNKAHWDYLLEEMHWLAADFAQERKWKKAGCRKIARMITRYHLEQQQKELKAGKEEALKIKRIASNMAKMVKEFWSNIEKVVEYKQKSRMDEKRKKAMDLHLNFIVDQTEKYSSWLTEGLKSASCTSSVTPSVQSSPAPSVADDDEFEPAESDDDDEETIELEEKDNNIGVNETRKEIDDLTKESEMPIEELLNSLPQEILDKPASIKDSDEEMKSDDDFDAAGSSADDEGTLEEEEQINKPKTSDHKQEIADLEAENDLTVEQLIEKYRGAYDSDFEMPETPSDSDDEALSSDDDDDFKSEANEESMSETEGETETEDVGVDFLLKEETEEKEIDEGPSREITDIAATAQSLQPTGYTLETTQVSTPVPFLLKHTLREYQHVGLDWLATLYEKKLNGILADEMGLGKTIQTIALLGHLACEKGIWGPHLIVVPTSVMLNWELELKKWCPGFKILTYYGTQKERKQKRIGWTKTNAFHVCITSYKLVIQDHQAFRRKKWKYFILDEAQNIKNFKSQRWQTLLNFQSQRRLLLTGTPLQNSLMELWSLMHFLMPHVFQSHRDFKEWFASPLTGMIEGSQEYNENLIRRLHKVLRPFLLRRLKADVEKQMPKKYEHVVMCRLSNRQRFLYDDFMSQTRTRETLATGHFMSVINILMQLRKVCNHPNLFDPRPTISPFQTEGISFYTASIVLRALYKDPLQSVDFSTIYPCISDIEVNLPAFAAHRIRKLQTPRRWIMEIEEQPIPSPRPKPVALKSFLFRNLAPPTVQASGRSSPFVPAQRSNSPTVNKLPVTRTPIQRLLPIPVSSISPTVPAQRTVIPTINTVPIINTSLSAQINASPTAKFMTTQQQSGLAILQSSISSSTAASQPITVQIHHTQQGTRLMIPSGQLAQLPAGFIQILQTSSGQQIITTPIPQSAVVQPLAQSSLPSVVTAGATSSIVTTSTNSHPTIAVVNGLPPNSVVSGTVSGLSAVRPSQPVHLPTSPAVVTSTHRPVAMVQPVLTQANHNSVLSSHTSSISSLKRPIGLTTPTRPVSLTNTVSSPSTSSSSSTSIISKDTKLTPKVIKTKPEKAKVKSLFYNKALDDKQTAYKKNVRDRTVKYNRRRCELKPVYGSDLRAAVSVLNVSNHVRKTAENNAWNGSGFIQCYNVQCNGGIISKSPWNYTSALDDLIRTPDQYLHDLQTILENYVFVVPPVAAPRISLHTSHPPPSVTQEKRYTEKTLHEKLMPKAACLHSVFNKMTVLFPELRLIQYDCGKLQTLDLLLRQLKTGKHRVLIFTQMTRMLDILESFLNYHGHRYLRLDGTTRVEKRQILMDRFNADKRIFCMILSTRSGGIGVNLTGADTVIFYDSDWNPTMDAQAQDRCHRIGQTRDVHIYRLISERTIEENILKKANQKRLLGDVAIEGGNFTTAFFKKNTLNDLFAEPSGLESLAQEKNNRQEAEVKLEAPSATTPVSQLDLEQALTGAEEDTDVQAAKTAKAEQSAELAEFDESIPWDEKEAERREEEMSKVEHELALIDKELTPVERYAVGLLEEQMDPITSEELEFVEEQIEDAKKDWELTRLKELKEEEERRAALEEDEMLFTYSQDTASQPFISDLDGELMPLWAPPTPPKDDNDIYIDHTQCFLYGIAEMPESELPPIYVKKEHKRIKLDPAVGKSDSAGPMDSFLARKQKVRKEEQPRVPRSLFDRPSAALIKMRRDAKMQKLRQGLVKPNVKPLSTTMTKPIVDISSDQPEWLIHEDWALLQAIQTLLNLPLNLMVISPAHIPNWDLVADVVNAGSRTYRSAKQCKNRYETVIVPREEGKILYDVNPRKQKKSKGAYKWLLSPFPNKSNRPMKTSQLFVQDNSSSITSLHTMRFDSVKNISSKRVPTLRPTLPSPIQKNPKHAEVLAENGVIYDQPKTPVQVAADRAERIAKEKKQSQANQERAQQAPILKATTTQVGQTATQLVPATLPATAVVHTGTLQKSVLGTGVAVSLARGVSGPGGIVVNTSGAVNATPFAAINKRIAGQTVGPSQASKSSLARNLLQGVGDKKGAQTVSALLQNSAGGLTANLATGSRVRTTAALTVQDISSVVSQVRVAGGATVITNTNLSPAQLAQRTGTAVTISAGTSSGTVAQQLAAGTTTKNLSPAQMNVLRQQARKHQAATLTQQQYRQVQRLQGADHLKNQQIKHLHTQGVVQQTVTAANTSLPKTVAVSTPLLQGLAQTHVVTSAQRLQVKGQKTTAVKQSIPVTLTQEFIALCKRNQKSGQLQQVPVTQGLAPQIIAQQVQHLQAGTQPIATLVKTVNTPNVTIPVSTVNVGGVNINVSVPQQKNTGKVTTITQQQQQHIRQLQLQQQKVTTLTHAQVQQVAAGKAQLPVGAVQIIQQQQKSLPTTVTVQHIQQIVKQQQQQQKQQGQAQTIQQIISSMSPHTTATTVIVTQAPQTATSLTRLTSPSALSQVRPIRHVTSALSGTTNPVHTILSTLAGSVIPSTTTTHTVSSPGTQAVKIGDQIVITQSKPTPSPVVATVTIPQAPLSPVVQTIPSQIITTTSSPKPITVASISRPQTPNITITSVVPTLPVTSSTTVISAIPVGEQAQQVQTETLATSLLHGDQLSAHQKTPYTMRLRNPPKH